jgi:VWFA-related protein
VLRQALTKIASRASTSFNAPDQQERRTSAEQRAASAEATAASAAAAGGAGASAAIGTSPGDAGLARIEARMLEDFDRLDRDQQGYASTNGLFAIISSLGRLPGRKSLVLFSEGIAVTPAVERLYLGVIDAANRANVSIYAMDAAGLRAASELAKIRDEVNRAAGRGINSGYSPNGASGGPLTKSLEDNESVLRQDPHSGLGTLTQGTGGLLFDSTNSLRQGFDRVESDLRNYYLVGYTPTNNVFDGRFRTITVKVKRPGVVVAARRGYFAVRDAGGPVNSWEAPALGALETKPVPNAFPVRAAALLFPERARPGLVPVVVEFKTAPITFQPAPDGQTYSSDFTVLVRFLDAQGQVARKVSQHYEVNGPIAAMDRAGQGDVVFYREPELAPGVYTMETVVRDAPSGKSSVRFSTVEVAPQNTADLRVSSLVIVKRGEKVAADDRRADNPLLVKDVLLRPNLGDPVSKGEKEVGFYFAVYPAANGPAPESSIEILQNAKLVSRLPLPASPADASGRIQQVARLPLDQLPTGTYELRAVVKQRDRQLVRSTMLRLVD